MVIGLHLHFMIASLPAWFDLKLKRNLKIHYTSGAHENEALVCKGQRKWSYCDCNAHYATFTPWVVSLTCSSIDTEYDAPTNLMSHRKDIQVRYIYLAHEECPSWGTNQGPLDELTIVPNSPMLKLPSCCQPAIYSLLLNLNINTELYQENRRQTIKLGF